MQYTAPKCHSACQSRTCHPFLNSPFLLPTKLRLSPRPVLLPSPLKSLISTMQDRYSTTSPPRTRPGNPVSSLMQRFQTHPSSPTRFIGSIALLITGGILLALTGITVTVAVMGLILFSPLILLTSPIWVPLGFVTFLIVGGFLAVASTGLVALAGSSWAYKYFRGQQPVGSDRFDIARRRVADTASHVKDYAREYGEYLKGKVKDAAPGA